MNQTQLAKELRVSRSLVTKYKQEGAPINEGVETVRRWREENFLDRADTTTEPELTIESLHYDLPEGEDVSDVLARLRKRERSLFAQVESIEEHLKTKPNAKLAAKLPALRRQYLDTSKAVVAVHRVLVSLGAGNELEQALQVSDRYIDSVLAAALFRLKNFHFRFVEGADRDEALKQVGEVFDELPALVPQFLEKAGMKELVMRAVKVVEQAKAEADKTAVTLA